MAAAAIEELMGPRNLQLISRENPIRVLRNEALENMERQEIQGTVTKKRKWGFWRTKTQSNPQITQISAD
jgi:hypothetical protein